MRRTLLFVLAGLILGAGAQVAIVLLVPLFAVDDAWARVGALGPDSQFHMLPGPADPAFVEAVCRFSLAAGPARIVASFPQVFWSVGVIDREGRNIYSFNDSASDQSRLDLAIATPAQAAAYGDSPPPSLANAIVAELGIDAGIVVVRAFVPDEAAAPQVTAALAAADCNAAI